MFMNTIRSHPLYPNTRSFLRQRVALAAGVALVVCSLGVAPAQTTYFWRSEAGNGNWNDANNWWRGFTEAPAGNEILRLDNTVQLTMANNLSSTARFKILFDSGSGARTISGSTLNTFFDFGGAQPLIQNSSTNPQTINFPIANGNGTGVNALDIEASGAALTFGGSIYGSGGARRLYFLGAKTNTVTGVISNGVSGGSITIYKQQAGMLLLSGNNTFSGGINFNDGELQLNNNNAAGTGDINVAAGADILSSGTGATLTNSIVLASGALPRLNSSGVLTLSGPISGNGGLLRGSISPYNSTLVLNGTNTFSGGVTITNNALQIGNKFALGTGTFTVGDPAMPFATLPQLVAHPTVLTNANAVTNPVSLYRDLWLVSGGQDIEFSGPVTLNSNVTLHATPNLILSGTVAGAYGLTINGNISLRGNNTYSGPNTINSSAILTINSSTNLGAGAVLTNSGTLRLLGSSPVTLSQLVYHSGIFDVQNTGGLTLSGNTVGSGGIPAGFTKTGVGPLTLSGNSTNNTSFLVNQGTLNFNCPAVNTSSRLTIGAGYGFNAASNSVLNWGTTGMIGLVTLASYNATNYTGTLNITNGTLTINATGFGLELGQSGSGTVNLSGGNLVISNNTPVNIGGLTTYGGVNGRGTLNIASPSAVTINGAMSENILFGENSATAAGTVNLDGGVLETSRAFKKTLGTGTFNLNGGTLRALGNHTNWLQLTTATVKSGGAVIDSGTFVVTNTQPLLHDTNITTDGGLTKLGAGRLTLQATNTYNGDTTISVGTLALNGNGSIADSPVISVAGSATLDVAGVTGGFTLGAGQTLRGNGSVAGAVTVNGTVAPGTSIGTLTLSNTPSLNGTIAAEINRTNAQTADKISFVAASSYGGTLTVTNIGPAAQSGDTFDLFDGPVIGAFTTLNLPPGGTAHWKTNNLVVDGTITFTNNSPVATNLMLGVSSGGSNTVLIVGGKHSPTDADGDSVAITGVTQGTNGTVHFTGTSLTYTSTNSATVDTFTYTVGDGVGGTDTKTVTVLVASAEGFNRLSPTGSISNGIFELTYLGLPTNSYAIEHATNLTPPIVWTPLLTNQAATNGYLIFSITNAGDVNFFRTKHVP